MKAKMVRVTNLTVVLWLVGSALVWPAQGQVPDVGGKRDVTVMTRNLYVGTDFSPIVLAVAQGNFSRVPGLVSAAYGQTVAADFPARAKGLAAARRRHRRREAGP